MSQEGLPPLRMREEDGSPDLIPVYTIIVDSGTISSAGPGIVRFATGGSGGGGTSFAVPLIVGSGGTGSTTLTNRGLVIGSGANPVQVLTAMVRGQLVVGSDATLAPQFLNIGSHGQVLSVSTAGAVGLVWADTSAPAQVVFAATGNSYVVMGLAADLTAERVLAASTGLGLVDGGAAGNAAFSVNTNVRDKIFGWFGAGNLATTMFVEEARWRIPFNMQAVRMDAVVTTSASGANIIVDLQQFATPIAAGTSMFVNTASQVNIPALFAAGSATSFDAIGTLFSGSFLGISLTQVGSTIAGSNLTITLVMRTS